MSSTFHYTLVTTKVETQGTMFGGDEVVCQTVSL
jgi:hypothetical protein